MEELKLKLTASEINSKEFQVRGGRYDVLQVDKFLDLIVNDYIAFEKFENSMKKIINNYEELVKTCEEFKDKLLEAENKKNLLLEELTKLKENENLVTSNIELLQRISVLEQALYNLGKDPSKIK